MGYTRINIKRKTSQLSAGRYCETELVPYYSCTAETLELYGRELYEAMQIGLKSTMALRVRHCSAVKAIRLHEKEYAVEVDGEIYDLYAADFGKKDNAFVILKICRFS